MIALEVSPNPHCEAVELRVFEDLTPPRPVGRVRLERDAGQAAWYAVVGWTVAATPCPAVAQKVSDSGDGTAWLIRGLGDAGLRLQAEGARAPWRADGPGQWGAQFLLLAEEADLNEEGFSHG